MGRGGPARPAFVLAAAPGAHARISVSPNYRMDTPAIPGRGEDSVGLAVDPHNPRHIVEVNADWEAGQCDHHVSFDGGRTWTGGHFRVPPEFSGQPCNVGPHLAEHMKAGIAYGSRGNVYATFSSPRVLPGGVQAGKTLFVVLSRDGGRTWGIARALAAGGPMPDPGPSYTLSTIGVDPARRGGPRRDRVYVAADTTTPSDTHPAVGPPAPSNENIAMVVSNDGGATWSSASNVNAPGTTATEQSNPVVGRDGAVYVAWRDVGKGTGDQGALGYIIVAKSRDHGRTWERVKSTAVMGYIYTGPPTPPFQGGDVYTASTFPRLAIDPHRNDLYLVFGQGPPLVPYVPGHQGRAQVADHFINPYSHVYFQRSTDGDRTWSAPKAINGAAPLGTNPTQTRHPSVSVAPNGRVDIVWQDRRNWYDACTNVHAACDEARLGDTYYAYSTNQGRGFSRNFRLTDRSMSNDVGYDYRFGTYWAYGPTAVSLGNGTLLVAWMDSRRGNFQNDTQDIYLTRVSFKPGRSVPVRRLRAGSPSAFSVALGRLGYLGGPEAVLAGTFVSRPWARIVIVNDHDVAGALAGGVLARANLAPVLASPASGLPAGVKAEVARMQPIGTYVIGNAHDLSPRVVSDLAAAGVPPDQIVRLSGGSAAGTAQLIADATAFVDLRPPSRLVAGQPVFGAAIIANPASRDAVTAAVLAADRRLPILYVGRDTLPGATVSALKQLGITRTLVIGGTRAVSDRVAAQLPSPTRVGGPNPYATSDAVVSQSILRGVPDNIVYVTNGENLMQTALLGATLGRSGALLLVSRGGAATAQRTIARSPALHEDVTRLVAIER